MHKGKVAVWAVATFGFAWLMFALVMPVFNRAKETSDLAHAYSFLLIPFAAQAVLLAAGAESWLPQRAETVYHDRVAEMADILRKSGSGVQLWLNEMGYTVRRRSSRLLPDACMGLPSTVNTFS